MQGVNKVFLLGRLGRDIELRYTQSGTAVTSNVIAVNESYKVGEDWKERTHWIECVFWGRNAEVLHEYMNKGDLIHVEGSLQRREYEDSEGVTRRPTEVKVYRFQMLTPKREQTTETTEDDLPF